MKVNLPFQRLKQGLAARSAPASVKGFMLLIFVKGFMLLIFFKG